MRMDKLEAMVDDHEKELANLKNRMMVVQKKGDSTDVTMLKGDIDKLKKEVTCLRSTDLTILFDKLEDSLVKEDVVATPNEGLKVETLGDINENIRR